MGIEYITLLIVVSLLGLMALDVPLGITTLTVSLGTAILYFGTRAGFFIVAANVSEVLHKYELIAVPFFVFMANVLERQASRNRCSIPWRSWAGGSAARSVCRPA